MFLIRRNLKVLAIGAHPDDIELGAGGFICRLAKDYKAQVNFLIITAGVQSRGPKQYESSKRHAEALSAARILGMKDRSVEILEFADCDLHVHGHGLIEKIEKRLFNTDHSPRFDLVLTHAGSDTHADHRTVYESTLSAVRDFHGVVLLYQSPSTLPNGFRPTFFVDLNKVSIQRKEKALARHVSQRDKPFMQSSRMRNIAETWSLFLRRPVGTYLEAFEVYKALI